MLKERTLLGKEGGKTNITFNIPLKCLRKTIKHKQLLFVFSKQNKNEKIIFDHPFISFFSDGIIFIKKKVLL